MERVAINIGQGVFLPGLRRAVQGDRADFYQGQQLRNWVADGLLLTWSLVPLNVFCVLVLEWERLETWAEYDKRDGREPIDYEATGRDARED